MIGAIFVLKSGCRHKMSTLFVGFFPHNNTCTVYVQYMMMHIANYEESIAVFSLTQYNGIVMPQIVHWCDQGKVNKNT